MRAIVLMSLAAFGYRVEDLPKTLKEVQMGRRKSHRNLIPAAMAHLMVRANMNIVERAAMDDDTIYGRFLTLQRDFHQIMAGGNGHGKNGQANAHGAPFPSSFVSQDPAPAPAVPAAPEGASLIIDGQEYV